ncbi:MAG TPA: serine protease [Drouetiella sp.]
MSQAKVLLLATLISIGNLAVVLPANALDAWERVDKKVKTDVYKLNVGIKLRLKDNMWAQLSDASPKGHFPVYSATKDDLGFRVISNGTCFALHTAKTDKAYFLTSGHVLTTNEQITKECERFFAAMRLYAEQQDKDNTDAKYKEVMQTVNLSLKGKALVGADLQTYRTTVDAIWDTYESYLSLKADPGRLMFNKYLKQAGVDVQYGYFLHPSGPASQQPLEAKVFKIAKSDKEPDLAVLTVSGATVSGLDLETLPASEGQEVQVLGFPIASDVIDKDADRHYSPTLSNGRITRITPNQLQIDAPVSKGNSGGPVISVRGKLLGVVALRAIIDGKEMPNFVGAVTAPSIQSFAPELFKTR